MLKLIDPRLSAEVVYVLASMGHGDEIVLADTNFPAASTACRTPHGSLLHLGNLTLGQAAEAVLSLLPLDTLVDDFACRMLIDGKPDEIPPVQAEAQTAVNAAEGRPRALVGLERHTFYARAKQAYAVIRTGERRFYGTMVLRKGVIDPP